MLLEADDHDDAWVSTDQVSPNAGAIGTVAIRRQYFATSSLRVDLRRVATMAFTVGLATRPPARRQRRAYTA